MDAVTMELGRDDPQAYIARDRRRALAEGRPMPDRVTGAALFADISGFTPLTEALAAELGHERGAEELTIHVSRVFQEVVDELDARGGDVIYFSGDAITCWLDGDDGSRATATALAMQAAMARVGRITTPAGTPVEMALKVAVAVGSARRFAVGDPEIQLLDVLAGSLIDDLAATEQLARKGEVLLHESALESLGDRVTVTERRRDRASGRSAGVVGQLGVEVATVAVQEPPPLDETTVRQWVLPSVYERLSAGRGEFLAELRPAYSMFVRFGGIDFDDDPDAVEALDTFIRGVQRVLSGYGGNLLQLTLGDKGAYLYAAFGAPIAHEDDAARAASAALDVRDLETSTRVTDIQIGLTRGRLRSGAYGHAMRRTFVCMGDAVNLAARLMSEAPAGAIYVDDRVRTDAGDAFIWQQLPDLKVKGKSGLIRAHALTGSLERASRRKTRFELALVGRRTELAALLDALERTAAGDGRIVGIAAEAGMGKSRLIAEFVRTARRRGVFVAFGDCQSFGTNASYFVWREIWHRLLGLDDGVSAAEAGPLLTDRLAAIDPELAPRAPLLGAVLGLDLPDTELTASFDAKLRKASLEDLLGRILVHRASHEPLVVVLEDCHWIDEVSRDLLLALGRSAASARVLFVLAYRPAPEPGGGLGVAAIPDFSEMALDTLGPEEAGTLIRSKLAQLTGATGEVQVDDSIIASLHERAEGHPLFIEELVTFLAGTDADLCDPAAVEHLELPESLHSLVLSRIDALAEEPRRTLKVASVVGRSFQAPILPGAYPELGELPVVLDHLATLRGADLVQLDREAEQAWLFKHVATQEVTYGSLPSAARATLHRRIGRYLEETDPDGIERHIDLLAHHFWNSDDEDRKRTYLERAADAAQARYANAAAIDYLTRLLPLLDGVERVECLLKLGKVQEFVGDWETAEATAAEALSLAEGLGDVTGRGRAHAALAETARKSGRYDDATAHLELARSSFDEAGDDEGVGQVLHLAGTVAAQRGDYEIAKERYGASLVIRERIGDRAGMAGLYSNLGIVAEYEGDMEESRRHNERALALRRELGDRWAIGVSENNLGMIALHEGDFARARQHFEASMRLNAEVGDRWMVAIGHNNLGNALRGLDEVHLAQEHYRTSLEAYHGYGDRWATAFLLEDLAILAARAGDHVRAHEALGAAERMRSEIDAPRAPSLESDLAEGLAASRAAIGDDASEAAVARGRSMDFATAASLGQRICAVSRTATA